MMRLKLNHFKLELLLSSAPTSTWVRINISFVKSTTHQPPGLLVNSNYNVNIIFIDNSNKTKLICLVIIVLPKLIMLCNILFLEMFVTEQSISLFSKLSYWNPNFLSPASTAVPIFLLPFIFRARQTFWNTPAAILDIAVLQVVTEDHGTFVYFLCVLEPW